MTVPSSDADALALACAIAEVHGYGNVIAHLRREWAECLIRECGLSADAAVRATIVDPYPLRQPAATTNSKPTHGRGNPRDTAS